MRKVNGKLLPTVTATAILGFFEEYRWLSNFYLCSIHDGEFKFDSSEHAYQAYKTKDRKLRAKIASHPLKGLKAFCRSIPLRNGWDDRCLRVKAMWKITCLKYRQHPELRSKLLATGNLYLEERNNWGDRYWGTCLSGGKFVGENMLGQVLMAYRSYLKGDLSEHIVDDTLLEIVKKKLEKNNVKHNLVRGRSGTSRP